MLRPLILHRAEVEVGDRDDVEDGEVVLAAIDLLVPLHRRLERWPWHVRCVRHIAVANPDARGRPRRPERGGEGVAVGRPDRRRQARRGSRAWGRGRATPPSAVGAAATPRCCDSPSPSCPTPLSVIIGAVRNDAGGDRIAIGQQHREARLVAAHPHPVAGEHVRPVGKGRDPPEALRPRTGCRACPPDS